MRRDREEADERGRVRKLRKTRQTIGAVIVAGLVFVVGWLAILVGGEVVKNVREENVGVEKVEYVPTVEIIDENNGQITNVVKEFVAKSEADFSELGYTIQRAVLPAGMMKEIDFYIEGFSGYVKVSLDRGTAVSAEDADRMMRYVNERGVSVKYIDVRVEGRGYYL